MNTLNKVLFALLLVGVSVNADLQAMKRKAASVSDGSSNKRARLDGQFIGQRVLFRNIFKRLQKEGNIPEDRQCPDFAEIAAFLHSEEGNVVLGAIQKHGFLFEAIGEDNALAVAAGEDNALAVAATEAQENNALVVYRTDDNQQPEEFIVNLNSAYFKFNLDAICSFYDALFEKQQQEEQLHQIECVDEDEAGPSGDNSEEEQGQENDEVVVDAVLNEEVILVATEEDVLDISTLKKVVQGAGKVLKALVVWPGSAIVAANLPYASIASTSLASFLSNATYVSCGCYAPYYVVKKMVIGPVCTKLRAKGYNCRLFDGIDSAIEFIQKCKVGRVVTAVL